MVMTTTTDSKWKRNANFPEVYGPRLQKRWVEEFAEKAHCQPPWLWESCNDWVEPDVVAWFVDRANRGAHEYPGAMLGRKFKQTALDRMQCLAATPWRMQRTGRCLLLQEVLDMVAAKDEALDVFLICVPDFYTVGSKLTQRQHGLLLHFLQSRALRTKDGLAHTTVVYVDDLKSMITDYGESVAGFLADHYLRGSSVT